MSADIKDGGQASEARVSAPSSRPFRSSLMSPGAWATLTGTVLALASQVLIDLYIPPPSADNVAATACVQAAAPIRRPS